MFILFLSSHLVCQSRKAVDLSVIKRRRAAMRKPESFAKKKKKKKEEEKKYSL